MKIQNSAINKCAFSKVNSYFPMEFHKYSSLVRIQPAQASEMWD